MHPNYNLALMKIIATSDWHLGNLFHGIDRLAEHRHFLEWLKERLLEVQPDALLVAGDVFDNSNPSAAAQSLYYEFLSDVTRQLPELQVVITAGNHDSANRLEAPRPLLQRQHIEVRGMVQRRWVADDEGLGHWEVDLDNLLVPIYDNEGRHAVVAALPFVRMDVVTGNSYSESVLMLMRLLVDHARLTYPGQPVVMMAHMYATGADIAQGSSERIMIGGQEQVDMQGWSDHPEYLACGHIHKRQPIWETQWAGYMGSVLPMSFAERDYQHGVDLIELGETGELPQVTQLAYTPQHPLLTLPAEGTATLSELKRLVRALPKHEGMPDEHSCYVELRLKSDQVKPEERHELELLVAQHNAVLCRLLQVLPDIEVNTLSDAEKITSVDDVVNRDPMEALMECYNACCKPGDAINDRQQRLLQEIVDHAKTELTDLNE